MDDRYEICEKCGELKRIGRKCLSCRSDQSPIQGERMNKKHLVKVLLNSSVSREWKEVLLKPYRWNTRR